MKKNMKYLQSKDKGITLVAMVITVIVLLLLAGIAIATLGGENGVFDILKVDQKINWLQLKNGPLFLHNIQVHDRMYLEV